jgi:hypothetical protein
MRARVQRGVSTNTRLKAKMSDPMSADPWQGLREQVLRFLDALMSGAKALALHRTLPPAKKWQNYGYGGYTPKGDRPATPAPPAFSSTPASNVKVQRKKAGLPTDASRVYYSEKSESSGSP